MDISTEAQNTQDTIHRPHEVQEERNEGRAQMSFNRGMDTENVVHLHNGVLLID